MNRLIYTLSFLTLILSSSIIHSQPVYHSVGSFSYSNEGLRAKIIKTSPQNPKIIYASAQHVNSSYSGFFDVFDISNPDSLKRVKRFVGAIDSFGLSDFVFKDNKLYGIGSKGLKVFDISNPSNPILTKSINKVKDGAGTAGIGYMTSSILVEGNKLHYGGFDYSLIDISDINNPVKLGGRSYSGINAGSIFQLSANNVIVADNYDVMIYNTTNPTSIVKTTLSKLVGDVDQVRYDDVKKVLYSTSETLSHNFIYSINMTNNTILDSFNYKSIAGFNPSSHSQMFIFKDTLYVGTSSGVALLDVSNPSKMVFLGSLPTGGSTGVYVDEEYLITNDNYNLKFYKRGLSTTSNAEIITYFDDIKIFPNPSSSTFTFENELNKEFEVQIFDFSGKLVTSFSSEAKSRVTIDGSNLQSGIYQARIQDSKGVVRYSKIALIK